MPSSKPRFCVASLLAFVIVAGNCNETPRRGLTDLAA